ncbi:MAG: phosphatidate cytidylyltransferase, partial [SAR86 cluster bacterium]|nr:phosphatidate cytidylyltransferase [SAR86 cluster bacterium]
RRRGDLASELYKNIIQRLPAALILVACILGILYLQNIFIILALLIAVGLLLIKEWLVLSDSKVDLKQIIFFVTLITFSIYFAEGFIDLFLAMTAIFWVIYSFYLISNKRLSLISFHNNYLGIFLVLGFLYGLTHLLLFSEFIGINKFFVLFVILFNTVIADVGAYLVGSSLGKTPLFPKISPNKTVEGLLGGAGLVLIFISTIYFFGFISINLALASLISLPFAFIGDYFESQLKRDKSIKDSGSLIPGHGGIWDRLDSHIAVVPIFILLTHLMV